MLSETGHYYCKIEILSKLYRNIYLRLYKKLMDVCGNKWYTFVK